MDKVQKKASSYKDKLAYKDGSTDFKYKKDIQAKLKDITEV